MNAFLPLLPRHRSPLFLAVAGALACAVAAPALAQDNTEAAARADDVTRLDTVVVTANKRVENIREVGASISVVGERELENIGASSLSDYAALVPGLQVQNNGSPGLTSVSLRGVAPMSSGATVATYIDETPLGSSGIYQGANLLTLDLLPYDISRVEVMRGPQGTLYGAGAIGGLIKYVTRAPDLSGDELRVGMGLRSVQGGGNDWNARVGASLPLQDDRLGLRMSFARNGLPGYIDNAHDGDKDINGSEQLGARAALLWDGEALDVNLGVLHQRINSDNRVGIALDPDTLEPLFGDTDARQWQPQPFSRKMTLVSLGLDWDLGWGDFVSATGWSQSEAMNQTDTTIQFGEIANLLLGLPDPGSSILRYDFDLDKFTQEFRLTSKSGGAFEWMVGVFYTKEDAVQGQFAWLGQLDGSPLPAPYDQMFGTLALLQMPSTYKETAVFANGSWRIGERFKLDAGVRQARNDQWFSQNTTEGILVAIGDFPGDSSENVFTWSLSPQFVLSEDVMLYARAATGYQPGGPNVISPGMPRQVDSSMLASYEIGLKSQFADRRVVLDMAAYRIDWEDIQVGVVFNGVGGLVNGGEARSEGFELSTRYLATEHLRLGLSGVYNKATVKHDFTPAVVPQPGYDVIINSGLAGDRIPYVPEWSWTATAEYGFSAGNGLDGQVGGAFRWVGDRVNGTTERQRVTAPGDPSTILMEDVGPPVALDSYGALDLYAGIGKGAWALRAYLNNATNEGGWSAVSEIASEVTGAPVQTVAMPIMPRTFGVELDFRF